MITITIHKYEPGGKTIKITIHKYEPSTLYKFYTEYEEIANGEVVYNETAFFIGLSGLVQTIIAKYDIDIVKFLTDDEILD